MRPYLKNKTQQEMTGNRVGEEAPVGLTLAKVLLVVSGLMAAGQV